MTAQNRREFIARFFGASITVVGLGAGGLILADGSGTKAVSCVRPPGALPEEEFVEKCIRCGRCSDACPNLAITPFTRKSGAELSLAPGPKQLNTPVIFPRRRACILCNAAPGDKLLCGAACPTGAIQPVVKDPDTMMKTVRMGIAVVDKQLCYSFNGASCGVCIRSCPFQGVALKEEIWERPVVDPNTCVGCGLCERVCIKYPHAISVQPRKD